MSVLIAAGFLSAGYRRCAVTLLLGARVTGGSRDATAGTTMQARSSTS